MFDLFAENLVTTPFNVTLYRVKSILLALSVISDTSLVQIKTVVSYFFEGIRDATIRMDGGAREI